MKSPLMVLLSLLTQPLGTLKRSWAAPPINEPAMSEPTIPMSPTSLIGFDETLKVTSRQE